jgi:hypothetical protein
MHERHTERRYGAATTGLINSSSNPNDVTIPTFVPFAEAVRFSFDGTENLSWTSTTDYGGSSFPVVFTRSYSVNSTCTGNITVDAAVNGIVHRDLVLVDGGKEVDFVDPDPGFVIASSMKNNNQKSSRHARLCAALILSSIQQFKVTPTVSSVSPTSGPIGTVVVISGTGLIQTTKVTIGGVKVTMFTVTSDNSVSASVPTACKTGKITVTTNGVCQ